MYENLQDDRPDTGAYVTINGEHLATPIVYAQQAAHHHSYSRKRIQPLLETVVYACLDDRRAGDILVPLNFEFARQSAFSYML
jgi:hypothetical protein